MDEVSLLDHDGNVIDAEDKARVHSADTPLHLGFSCHLVDRDGRILVTPASARSRQPSARVRPCGSRSAASSR
jgi:isopentenyl-diphosphate delta-isomerase